MGKYPRWKYQQHHHLIPDAHIGVKLNAEVHVNVFTHLFCCAVSDGEIK
jgi:hypothetical protein